MLATIQHHFSQNIKMKLFLSAEDQKEWRLEEMQGLGLHSEEVTVIAALRSQLNAVTTIAIQEAVDRTHWASNTRFMREHVVIGI